MAVSLSTGTSRQLFQFETPRGQSGWNAWLSWAYSQRREELYVLIQDRESRDALKLPELRVYAIAGQLLHTLPVPPEGALRLVLSPDENRLVLEREWRRSSAAQDRKPSRTNGHAPSRATGPRDRRRIEARHGGFLIHDLDSGQITEGPDGGHSAAWSPDGGRIAYLDRSSLRVWDQETGRSHELAVHERADPEFIRPWHDRTPVWSPDGQALLVGLGFDILDDAADVFGVCLLVLEFDHDTFLLIDHPLRSLSWATTPSPFGSR